MHAATEGLGVWEAPLPTERPSDGWLPLPGVVNYWAVAFASPQSGWLVGTEGRILKISFKDN